MGPSLTPREEVLYHYGTVCACCLAVDNLQIDHINGGGDLHRAKVGKGATFYRWLIANGFPEGYQTLCGFCNNSKHAYEKCQYHNNVYRFELGARASAAIRYENGRPGRLRKPWSYWKVLERDLWLARTPVEEWPEGCEEFVRHTRDREWRYDRYGHRRNPKLKAEDAVERDLPRTGHVRQDQKRSGSLSGRGLGAPGTAPGGCGGHNRGHG